MVSPFISSTYFSFIFYGIYMVNKSQKKGRDTWNKKETLNTSSVTLLNMCSEEKDGRISSERLDSWTIYEILEEGLVS